MYAYLLAFCASFVFVFLKSWQQQAVVYRKYPWMIPTSLAMATCEVYVVATTAQNGWGWLVLFVGFGGGLGCMSSTYIHSKWIMKK